MRRLLVGFVALGLLAASAAWGADASASVSVSVRVVPAMGISATSHLLDGQSRAEAGAEARRVVALSGTARLETPSVSPVSGLSTSTSTRALALAAAEANVRQLELTVVNL
ncbi:MAG: hypothetical protein LJE95_05095 [Acidobacteria bacterium]|jgi:hypothetical protein|nr:hypothetical protein [Acidobacteriota bacterium]